MAKELAQLSSFTGGRYEVVRSLGQGPLGWTVLALDRELEDSPVTLKIIFPQFASDKGLLERLRAQLVTSRQLAHDNIVKVHDLDQGSGGHPLITSEWIRGVSLEELIRKEPRGLPADETVRILVGMLTGLSYAHRKSALHGNLKPSNIFISEIGTVKLADFGLAEAISEESGLTRTGQSPRQPLYMAPEQFISPEPSIASDLYALGVITFELLKGSPPFPAKEYFALADAHRNDPPPIDSLPASTPGWIATLLRSLLSKEPASRPQSADAVLDIITGEASALASTRLSNRTISLVKQTPKRRLMRRLVTFVLVVALIGLLYVVRNQAKTKRWAARPVFATEYWLQRALPGSEVLMYPFKMAFGIKGSMADYRKTLEDAPNLDENELQVLWYLGFPRDLRDEQGRTLLHILADKNSKASPFDVQPAFGDLNLRDKEDRTPVMISVINQRTEDIYRIIARTVPLNVHDSSGRTALHYSVESRQKFITHLLMVCGASIYESDNNGDTPLHIVARRGFFELLSGMVDLKHKPAPNFNLEGETALVLTLQHPYPLFAQLAPHLISDLSLRARNPLTGESVLIVAVRKAEAEHVVLLLEHGAPTDIQDDAGMTALSYAAQLCKKDVTQRLLKAGADVSLKNRNGKTATDLARDSGCAEVSALLSQAGKTS